MDAKSAGGASVSVAGGVEALYTMRSVLVRSWARKMRRTVVTKEATKKLRL